MPEPTEVGLYIADLKARSGLSWADLASAIGASSGDYVRKVASGAKPGNNLRGAVTELRETGRATTTPERRRAASGELARVRGGAPKAPTPPAERPTLFAGRKGELGASQAGHRETDLRRILNRAARRNRNVKIKTRAKINGTWRDVTIGQKGGYDPRTILEEAGDDILGWVEGKVYQLYDGAEFEESPSVIIEEW